MRPSHLGKLGPAPSPKHGTTSLWGAAPLLPYFGRSYRDEGPGQGQLFPPFSFLRNALAFAPCQGDATHPT